MTFNSGENFPADPDKVGAVMAATSTAPGLNKYIRYSKQGESVPGVARGASVGCVALMPDRVQPSSSTLIQRLTPASTLRMSCSYSMETQPSASTNALSKSRVGSDGLKAFTWKATVVPAPVSLTSPRADP
jgi:hypothetical protein